MALDPVRGMQNSEFSAWAAMYKNTAAQTVAGPWPRALRSQQRLELVTTGHVPA
jgi:hypothetical protein